MLLDIHIDINSCANGLTGKFTNDIITKGDKMYNESRKNSTIKYKKEHCEQLNLTLKKGTKEQWKQQANAKGYISLTSYLSALISKDRESDLQHAPEKPESSTR